MNQKLVLPLSHVGKEDEDLTGHKAVALSSVQNLVSVPNGFVITTAAFEFFLRSTGIDIRFKQILKNANHSDPDSLTRSVAEIQSLILGARMPQEIAYEIFSAYHSLKDSQKGLRKLFHILKGSDTAVVVRSGQEVSKTGVECISGEANLAQAVQKFWAWHFSPQKLRKSDFPTLIVQSLLNIDTTAFVHSQKSDKKKNIVSIEAVWGSGELAKLGKITGDTYEIDAKKNAVIFESISRQEIKQIHFPNQSSQIVSIPPRLAKERKLSHSQALEVAKLATKLSTHFYFPQVYEFALANHSFHLISIYPEIHEAPKPEVQEKHSEKSKIGKPEIKPQRPPSKWKELLKASSSGVGVKAGYVRVIKNRDQLHRVFPGDILVVKTLNQDFLPSLRKAGAVVTETPLTRDYLFRATKDLGVPYVTGAKSATTFLKENQVIIVNASEGKLYTFN